MSTSKKNELRLLGEMADSKTWLEIYKMTLEHLIIPVNKEVLKNIIPINNNNK